MSTKVYMGGGGVQKVQKLVYVVYGWRLLRYFSNFTNLYIVIVRDTPQDNHSLFSFTITRKKILRYLKLLIFHFEEAKNSDLVVILTVIMAGWL